MRLALALLALLAGCAGSVTLVERDATAWSSGTLDYEAKTLRVRLRGEAYAGNVIEATDYEVAPGQPSARAPRYVVEGNAGYNATALLEGSRGGSLRCIFRISVLAGGYGRCFDREYRAYDLFIE
jgi:hypothetical protein